MIRAKLLQASLCAALAVVGLASTATAQGPVGSPAPVRHTTYNTQDWGRFYHYPYVYYPQNFWGSDYYRSTDSMYHRYPAEMRIPVYNKQWFNSYPEGRLYHQGHHFILDTF